MRPDTINGAPSSPCGAAVPVPHSASSTSSTTARVSSFRSGAVHPSPPVVRVRDRFRVGSTPRTSGQEPSGTGPDRLPNTKATAGCARVDACISPEDRPGAPLRERLVTIRAPLVLCDVCARALCRLNLRSAGAADVEARAGEPRGRTPRRTHRGSLRCRRPALGCRVLPSTSALRGAVLLASVAESKGDGDASRARRREIRPNGPRKCKCTGEAVPVPSRVPGPLRESGAGPKAGPRSRWR